MKRTIYLAAIIALSATAVGGAYAAKLVENDALSITTAKIDLTQAIAAAEQQVGGKAARAEFEQENGQGVFNVEVVNGQQVMDVTIDAMSGKMLAAVRDDEDHSNVHERDD